MTRFWIGLAAVAAVLVAACVASLAIGAVPIKAVDVLRAVADPSSVEPVTATIVRSIRAPRVVAACVVGWALALSGLCFQSLLKNPLASEYTLGVASGAS